MTSPGRPLPRPIRTAGAPLSVTIIFRHHRRMLLPLIAANPVGTAIGFVLSKARRLWCC
jgi:hypothetical protein